MKNFISKNFFKVWSIIMATVLFGDVIRSIGNYNCGTLEWYEAVIIIVLFIGMWYFGYKSANEKS